MTQYGGFARRAAAGLAFLCFSTSDYDFNFSCQRRVMRMYGLSYNTENKNLPEVLLIYQILLMATWPDSQENAVKLGC